LIPTKVSFYNIIKFINIIVLLLLNFCCIKSENSYYSEKVIDHNGNKEIYLFIFLKIIMSVEITEKEF